jgi:hypothetical protein
MSSRRAMFYNKHMLENVLTEKISREMETFEVNRFPNYSFVVEHGAPAEHGCKRFEERILKVRSLTFHSFCECCEIRTYTVQHGG